MPLFISKSIFQDSKLGVWHITEDADYFKSYLGLTKEEKSLVKEIKGRRKLEWLSSRHLIHLMSSREVRAEILKDEFGKPYIADSNHYISFSHSHGMSAAIASKKVVGIDIQYIVPKISRIASKFVRQDEFDQINKIHSSKHLDMLHIIWGAKESLYKSYGKRSLDFKEHMKLSGIKWSESNFWKFEGEVKKEKYYASFNIEATKLENHILVYAEMD